MSLYSGRRIHGYKWEALPIDEHVIARVEQLAKEEDQPIMNRGMPCFEWASGAEIGDDPDTEDEQRLTITNGKLEIEGQDEVLVDMQPQLEQLEDGYVIVEDEITEQNNEDIMIVIPEESIVSDKEEFDEPEDVDYNGDEDESEIVTEEREVAAVALDDVDFAVAGNTRPRRENAGAIVERIQMDFSGKGYGAKRQFNFVANGEQVSRNPNEKHDPISYMKIACDKILTQLTANIGIKKFGEPTIAAMIREFTQMNEGTISGKPVVIPADASTLTYVEEQKVIPEVNLII